MSPGHRLFTVNVSKRQAKWWLQGQETEFENNDDKQSNDGCEWWLNEIVCPALSSIALTIHHLVCAAVTFSSTVIQPLCHPY